MSAEARGPEADQLWRELLAHVEACSECLPDDLCANGGKISHSWRRASRRASDQARIEPDHQQKAV